MLSWSVYPLLLFVGYWFYKRIIEELPKKTIISIPRSTWIPIEKNNDTNNTDNINDKSKELELYIDTKYQYLKSPEWNQKRIERLDLDNYTCQLCHLDDLALDVHHIRYVNIPNESLKDLRSLCRTCHESLHKEFGYPSSLNDYQNNYYWKKD